MRAELYDKVLEQPESLERLEYFLRPLFCQEIDKIYNLNRAFQLQKPLRGKAETDSEEMLDFDPGEWEREQEMIRREKLKRYEQSIAYLLRQAAKQGEISLKEIAEQISEEDRKTLIPNVEIFKEIMVELIRNKEIDLVALRKEQSEYIQEQSGEFQLNLVLLHLTQNCREFLGIVKIETFRIPDGKVVVFSDILDESGEKKSIRCSNVQIRITEEE